MMISTRKGFGFICVPKCASTSIENYIRKKCNIRFSSDPKLKHLTYREYEQYFLPLLKQKRPTEIRMFAVLRHPLDWVRSWYTYRQRDILADPKSLKHDRYTGNLTFDEFVQRVISDRPKIPANIRSQSHYLIDGNGNIGVDTLFTMENFAHKLPEFLGELGLTDLGELPLKKTSERDTALDVGSETLQMIETHFSRDLELYQKHS